MTRLYLLRHARAGWPQTTMRDFERPLDPVGISQAISTGAAMRMSGYQPDLTLCSTACRARQTLEKVAESLNMGHIIFLDQLYTEDAAFYLDTLRQHGHAGSLLIVGHNPMMEDLTGALSGDGDAAALNTLGHGFPACGLAVVNFENSLSEAAPGKGYLEAFFTPPEN